MNPIRALRNRFVQRRRDAALRRLPKGWLTPEEDSLAPPRSVWIGPGDPISHYYRWIWEYLAYLTLLADLRRTSVVLELGCGHGRTAHGLLGYLRSPGEYYGLDVDGPRIRNAQERIESRWPNFHFIHADVYNRHYNPEGRATAANSSSRPMTTSSTSSMRHHSSHTSCLTKPRTTCARPRAC